MADNDELTPNNIPCSKDKCETIIRYNHETKLFTILTYSLLEIADLNKLDYEFLGVTEDGGHYFQLENVKLEDILPSPLEGE